MTSRIKYDKVVLQDGIIYKGEINTFEAILIFYDIISLATHFYLQKGTSLVKKIISLLLIIAMLFTLSACNTNNDSADHTQPNNDSADHTQPDNVTVTKAEPTAIQLTVDNIGNYFNINGYSDGYNESYYRDFMGFNNYTCSCTMHISIEKMYDFEIKEPIELKFRIFYDNWDSISGTKYENYQTYAYISVPTSGSINKTYPCSTKTYFTMASSMPNPSIEEVIGTIYVYD